MKLTLLILSIDVETKNLNFNLKNMHEITYRNKLLYNKNKL